MTAHSPQTNPDRTVVSERIRHYSPQGVTKQDNTADFHEQERIRKLVKLLIPQITKLRMEAQMRGDYKQEQEYGLVHANYVAELSQIYYENVTGVAER